MKSTTFPPTTGQFDRPTTKRTTIDPPDAPTEPKPSLLLAHILTSLPDLSPSELSQLKEAVVDAQMEQESHRVLEGSGVL